MTHERRNFFIGLIGIGWVLSAFVAYAATHKPFTPEVLLTLLQQVWALIVAFSLVSLAGGIGRLFNLQRFGLSPLIITATEAALGLGCISISVLILGATLGVNLLLLLISAAGMLLLRKHIGDWWRAWSALRPYWKEADSLGRTIAILIGLLITCAFATALAPTTQFDALTYHLAIPQIFIQQGRIVFVTDSMFWGMTQLPEMLYLLAMVCASANAAHLLNLLVGLLVLLIMLVFSYERTGNLSAAWVAIASLLCGFTLVWLLSAAYTEWFVMLYSALILAWLTHWVETRDNIALALIGVYAGMAISAKYTAGLILLSSGLVVFNQGLRQDLKKLINWLLILGGSAILIYLPWTLKNFIATGNPFYPIIFPTPTMDVVRLAFYQFRPGEQDWSRLLLIPWQATLLGVEGKNGYSASIGALLLGISPLAGLGWRKKTAAQKASLGVASILVISGFLVWAGGSQFRGLLIQTRLFLSFFPAWAFLSAEGFANLRTLKAYNIRFGILTSVFVLMALGFNTYETLRDTTATGGFDVLMQATSDERYLKRNLGDFKTAMDEINTLPKDARVLMLWETRSYYCLPLCDPDEVIDRWYHDWTLAGNTEAVLARWHAAGYTHVLLYRAGADFIRTYDKVAPFTQTYWDGLDLTLENLTLLKQVGRDYVLYVIPK